MHFVFLVCRNLPFEAVFSGQAVACSVGNHFSGPNLTKSIDYYRITHRPRRLLRTLFTSMVKSALYLTHYNDVASLLEF